jgi:Outer membrane protein beta-barrel domain
MSDNFTHNVHDLMDGFQLTPSEDVWKKVEQGIQNDKKRRPKFFWWLFPMLALLLGGTYLLMQSNKQATNKQVANAQQKTSTQNKNEVENSTSNRLLESKKEKAVIDDNEIKGEDKTPKTATASPVVVVEPNEKAKENVALKSKVAFTNSNRETRNANTSLNNANQFFANRSKKQKKQKGKYNNENSNEVAGDYAAPINLESNEESNLSVDEDLKTLQTISSIELNTQTQNTNLSIAPIKDNLNFPIQHDAQAQIKIKQRKWHWAIVAGAGTSNLSSGVNGIFDAQKAIISAQNILTAGGNFQPSDVKPNAFYNVGLEVSYDLSNKLQLSSGLQLNAFSNSIQVGTLVSNPTRFFDLNGQFLFAKDAHYTSGNTNQFNNHFLYLNMPLSVDYAFAHLKTIGFHVQTGFDIGYLVSNDALIHDPTQNIYYAPTTQLNNWRYGFHLGASVSLMKDQLSINPMMRFGLNDLYNAGSYSQLSLSSFGLQMKLRIK